MLTYVEQNTTCWLYKYIYESETVSSCLNSRDTGILSRDSAVGIATDYGLDDREVGVRVPVE
jgi:hypothetical protein